VHTPSTLVLPRSVVLALWLAVRSDVTTACEAVQDEDEPHTVVGGGFPDLHGLLAGAGRPLAQVAAVLPVPGDPASAPREVTETATLAGEAVLLRTPDGRCSALVPEIVRFGSPHDYGHLVTWSVAETVDWRPTVLAHLGSLADAERELREGLSTATEALVDLDVARWRPEAAAQIGAVRDAVLPASRLPAGIEGRRVRVLASAARLRAIVALAAQDDGGAVNMWQADQRSTALREVDRVARRALAAAATTLEG